MTSVLDRRPAHAPPPESRSEARRRRVVRLARSRWTRFGLPALAGLCALAAATALEFPALSNWYAGRAQQALAAQLDNPTIGSSKAVPGDGAAVGRIDVPAIGLDMVVVQGVTAGDLAKGPGHYPQTAMPCAPGNAGIAGHRTTFLHPFSNLNELAAGDTIEIVTPRLSCTYLVTGAPVAVSPRDTAVLAGSNGQSLLTLTTCTPRGSAAQRLVVQAVLLPKSLRPAPSSVKGNAA